MNLQQLILYSTFSVIYCRDKHFSKATLTVQCDKNGPMCDSPCVNHECDVNFCHNFYRDSVISDLISECSHFRCTTNCKHCYCYPDNTCFCKTGYVINPKDETECLPHCSKECKNGWCSAPETCSCDNKYKLSSNKYECIPTCSSACISGQCDDNGLCLCTNGHFLRSCQSVDNDEPKPQSCSEGYALQNNACKPVCETKCEGNSKCTAPNRCSCPRNYKWSNETSQCESTCTECSNGTLKDGICMCNDEDKIDPNNKCKCISKCFPPCVNGYCSVDGVCTCKTNYTWNEDTSKCELKPNNCINGMCVKIKNETFSCTSNHETSDNTVQCKTNFSVCNGNQEINNKATTWEYKCEILPDRMGKNLTCNCNENINMGDETARCVICKNVTCTCNDYKERFACYLISNFNKDDSVPNSTPAGDKYDGSYEKKMEQNGSLETNNTLYIISASVVVGVIAIIITIIIIRKKLNQRASSESAGGPTSSLHLTKSYDEEIVDNVELYGSI